MIEDDRFDATPLKDVNIVFDKKGRAHRRLDFIIYRFNSEGNYVVYFVIFSLEKLRLCINNLIHNSTCPI